MAITLHDLQTLLEEEKIKKLHFKEVVRELLNGKTYQHLLGISDDAMQEFYQIARSYLDNHQYAEAADCFLFLIALNPLQPNLWIKSGVAEQHLNHDDAALEAYSMAMLCDADDPFPHLYSADIYCKLKRFEEARGCLSVCKLLIEEHPSWNSLNDIVKKLEKKIEKRR